MKFGEGAKVSKKLKALAKSYTYVSDAPVHELPRVQVVDVGRISRVNSIKSLFGDFLKILHGQDITTGSMSPAGAAIPIANVANIAVVADRFDALPHTATYVRRKRILETIDARNKAKAPKPTEERLRQRLLVGVLLDHPSWLSSASQNLIIAGSVRWKRDAPEDNDLPLWWDQPHGLEGEYRMNENPRLDPCYG
jgi:hypothetical protein